MKIRKGFVSNSSSSSFIVVFKDKPKTKEELKSLLYGDIDELQLYDFCRKFTTDELSEGIFTDLAESMSYTEEQRYIKAMELLDNWTDLCHTWGGPPNCETLDEIVKQAIRGLNKTVARLINFDSVIFKERLKKEIDNAISEEFGNDITLRNLEFFHFCDEQGEFETLLEHGPTFEKLPHVTFSHH